MHTSIGSTLLARRGWLAIVGSALACAPSDSSGPVDSDSDGGAVRAEAGPGSGTGPAAGREAGSDARGAPGSADTGVVPPNPGPPPTPPKDAGVVTGGNDASLPPPTGSSSTYGAVHHGQYDLGPVEFHGSFNNSCSPYTPAIESLEGVYLAGLDSTYNGDGHLCDACVLVTTARGKSLVLRVVTTGQASGPENMDISQRAFDSLTQGEYPRTMTWQLAKCPDTGKIAYQFQTGAHVDWTSFWVRNARVPISKVEVKSSKHASFVTLRRETDGTLNDDGGFGAGSFTLRVTGVDGQVVTDTFAGFTAGGVLTGTQFP